MSKLIWWNRVAFLLLALGAVILGYALTLQPKISDDWYLIWRFHESTGALGNFVGIYTGFTGRAWLILLSTFVLPNPVAEIIYRAFILIEILLLVALAWYCALGPGAWRRTRDNMQAMAIFGSLLWFALPARDETVAWLVGNFVYLVPAVFCLAFIAWIERALIVSPADQAVAQWRRKACDVLSFLVGVSAGVSHEQVVAAGGTYLALTFLRVMYELPLGRRKIGSRVWIAALGFAVGAAVLVSAPGNYIRMSAFGAPSVPQIIERMALYVPGAFFEIGTGSTGKYIWLGALVFTLLHFDHRWGTSEIYLALKRGIFWWAISLVSLLAMAPATNFISPRTTFFAVIFLFIGFAAMVRGAPSIEVEALGGSGTAGSSIQLGSVPHFVLTMGVLSVLGCLVFVEAITALISNMSVAAEFAKRDEIVENARHSTTNGDTPIRVPFIATETSALTYVQNPEHDRAFLVTWGSHIGRTIEHDVSNGAPLPNSFKPLKAVKFRHRD